MDRAFKGIWIPKDIYLDTNLNWTEKILLLEIDSLDGEEGCFASNEHFAKHLMISKDRVSKLISKLNLLGYITVKIIYKNGSKQIEKRILHSTIGYSRKQLGGIVKNTDTPIGENTDTPIGENNQDNNTNINNTNINNTINKYMNLSFIDDVIDKVNLTKEQYEKLIQKYNKKQVHNTILALDNTLANNPKKYKDHYRTINNWCAKGYYKSEDGKSTKKGSFFNFKEREYDYDELEKVLTGEKYIDDEEERKLLGW